MEHYQENFSDKIKQLKKSILLNKECAEFMARKLRKNVQKMKNIIKMMFWKMKNLNRQENFLKFQEKERDLQKAICKVDIVLQQELVLLKSIESSKFYNDAKEEKQDETWVGVGQSEELIYEIINKNFHENFSFLSEADIKKFIDDYLNEKLVTKKLRKLIHIVEKIPMSLQLHFNLGQFKDDLNDIQLSKSEKIMIPSRIDDMVDALIMRCEIANLNKGLSVESTPDVEYLCRIQDFFIQQLKIQSE